MSLFKIFIFQLFLIFPMRTTKELKAYLKKKASEDPDKYYATDVLRESGFSRKKCEKCGTYFWSTQKRKVCGDSVCSGGFRFFGKKDNSLSYVETWQKFSKLFKEMGYTPVKRYPVVARWNPTMEFTIASIAAFQPYVVSGEVEPPANPLVIPQFCIRFDDIDNVGYTGSHMTGFVMIGQHMFVPKDEWDQDKVFGDIKRWLNEGLEIPDSELIFHEDAWAGGGNAGPCMEYFSKGLELGNQVYMLYEQTPDGLKDLNLKVLDMGMGHERNTWFLQGTNTIYEAVFPTVIEKLLEKTDVEYDNEFMKKFAPYAGKLNLDEVDDVENAWDEISEKLSIPKKDIKEKILPLAGIFSVAEHARVLLFALNDGALPSNVGGGHNLRMLYRRAMGFIDDFAWDVKMSEVCSWHAEDLAPIFPELNNLDNISKILDVERKKYRETMKRTKKIVQKTIKQEITEEKLLELYDSKGISPERIKKQAEKIGKKVKIPKKFFAKVAELHETTQAHQTEKGTKLDLKGIPQTKANYYSDYTKTNFNAKVLKVIDTNVVLDRTLFYPTSGGQMHDKGTIHGIDVVDVFRQGPVIVHVLKQEPNFQEGDTVQGKVNFQRRKQLSQHHTATHIINAAARKVLGNHINQAGAKKTKTKAHLDVTHYQLITDKELQQIENEANKIVGKSIDIEKKFYPRRAAEDKFGMDIYQGGAVPGKQVRIIQINDLDVEACGGTHLNNTSEVGKIKITKSTKVQDGVVRIEFVAGEAAQKFIQENQKIIDKATKLLDIKDNQLPARAQELFKKWKKARKAVKKKKEINIEELELTSEEIYEGDVLKRTAEILRTQPKHVPKTIKRFLDDLEEAKEKLR